MESLLLKVVLKKRASLLSENVNRQLAESKEVVGLPFIGNLTVMVHCFLNKRPDCYVTSKLEKKKILSHGLTWSPCLPEMCTLEFYFVPPCLAMLFFNKIKHLHKASQSTFPC